MNLIKRVILFFKKLLNKEESIKMIEEPIKKDDKIDFINSLKVDTEQKHKKKKVETLTCVGDGLGIQTKIEY